MLSYVFIPPLEVPGGASGRRTTSVCISFAVATSNTATVPSMVPHASRRPSGLYASDSTKEPARSLCSACDAGRGVRRNPSTAGAGRFCAARAGPAPAAAARR